MQELLPSNRKTRCQRVMSNVCKFIEKRLKLVVNLEKSQVAKSDRVKFLGMTIVDGSSAMTKVKKLTPRGSHLTLEKTIAASKAYSNHWFIVVMGLKIRSNQKLSHWLDLSQWVRLT
ncbi:MAG TPA: hypothetical protein ENK06_14925 [Gammaproteobacteria bacterium]|nr:hypothetical protein [Gammaproteobacteria bacterium]